ncbi:MAG: hypothetical protein KJ000_09995 [Pirellulaceae bacterium]|nr:hypothetical protein [Pirellulaceae bacterium]
MTTIMRFKLRTALMIVACFAALFGAIAAATNGYCKRLRITAELTAMGACWVAFDDNNDPEWVAFNDRITSSDIARYTTLRYLDFTDSNVRDEDLQHLTELPAVFYLELDGTNISDAGVKQLSSIQHLEVLDLTGTRVTDAAAQDIAMIRGLRGVNLSRTMVTSDGIDAIRSLRPDVWVKHDIPEAARRKNGQAGSERGRSGEGTIKED